MCVRLGHAKFQPFSAKGIFSSWELNEWVENSMKNWPYLESGER